MNRYRMQKRINTPIVSFEEYDYGGYHIEPWVPREPSSPLEPGLLVSRELDAANANEAMKDFLVGLEPIVNSLSILTQTIVFPLPTGSHLLYRLNENDERLFYANINSDSDVAGMCLYPETFEDLKKIPPENAVAISYLREANGALTSVQQLSALISSAEAFAGTVMVKGACKACGVEYERGGTNNVKLKEILGDELYKELYTRGLRHKVMHGGSFEGDEAAEITNKLYTQMTLGYLKPTFNLDSLVQIEGAPRSFVFISSRHGGKMIADGDPDLRMVEAEWDSPKSFNFNPLPQDY